MDASDNAFVSQAGYGISLAHYLSIYQHIFVVKSKSGLLNPLVERISES